MNSVTINKIINLFLKNLTAQQIILRNSFWIVLGKFIGGILRALLVIFAARLLGASEYGSFSLAMNFVLIFSFLPELGLTAILTREISKEKEEERKQKIFNDIFILSIILSFLSYCLILILGNIFIKDFISKGILPILALMLIFDIFREFAYAIYRAELKSELQGIFHLLTNLLLFIGGLISLYYFRNANNLALAYLFTIFLGFILSNLFIFKYFQKFKFTFNYKNWLYYFNSSWPIALANALYLFLLFIDTLILGWYFSSKVVGIYTSSVKINEFLIIFPTGISLALLPMFSKNLFNKEKLKNDIEFGIKISYLLILPLIFGGFIFSHNLIHIIFGSEYLTAHYALKILIPSLIASSIFMIFSQFLIAINKRIELLFYEFAILLINVLGNLILIPHFDFMGAAYMTTVSNFLAFLLGYFITSKYVYFNVWYGLDKPLISSTLMVLILLIFRENFFLSISLGIISYLILLILLKEEIIIKLLKKLFSSDGQFNN